MSRRTTVLITKPRVYHLEVYMMSILGCKAQPQLQASAVCAPILLG